MKVFLGIYTTGGGLGTKMGIYVTESDCEQSRPFAIANIATGVRMLRYYRGGHFQLSVRAIAIRYGFAGESKSRYEFFELPLIAE